MDLHRKQLVVDAFIEEYLKSEPNTEDVKKLMKELNINYSVDDLANMKAVLNCIEIMDNEKEEVQNV